MKEEGKAHWITSREDMTMYKYKEKQEGIRDIERPKIETFENQYTDREFDVTIVTGKGELNSICPVTGLPDFATATITYWPRKYCIELKSLKEYLISFRGVGIFHEHLANMIADDLFEACMPWTLDIKIEMNPRGNITTTVETSRCGVEQDDLEFEVTNYDNA